MKYLFLMIGLALCWVNANGQEPMRPVPFDTSLWDLDGARVTEHLGRTAVAGTALLKGVEFKNGIIEVDMAVNLDRSYPGILFRIQNPETNERVYIRPHRARLYEDAIQYEATFNGIDSWQLYNGPGKTANAEFPKDAWLPLRLEVSGNQCRVFINDASEPSLVIHDLQHGESTGGIALMGPADGSAWFSNFRISTADTPEIPAPPAAKKQIGFVRNWEISQVFKYADVDIERSPQDQGLKVEWRPAESLPSGLVDISRFYGRLGADPDCIWAKTTIDSDKDEVKLFSFGYSDFITIFCNGELLYEGSSSYRSRDPSFLGIVGLFDHIALPLRKGENELLISVVELFGGWGFTFRDATAGFLADGVTKEWEAHTGFRMPESVVYDKARDLLYVSNYYNNGTEFISKVSPSGKMVEATWVRGVARPTGMVMYNGHLFVVDRKGVKEIDPDKGEIVSQIPVPGSTMLNDIAIGPDGVIYLTDSRANSIVRIVQGTAEVIMQGKGLAMPNGLAIRNGLLYVGNSQDGSLFSLDLATNELRKLTCLEEGTVIDGLTFDRNGNLLISDYNGRLLCYSADGVITELVNMDGQGRFFADFGFIEESGLVVIPTYSDNRLIAFKLPGKL